MTKSKDPLVSVIVIDYKKNNPYLVECLDAIQKQTYKTFEVILVCDYKVNLSYPKLRQKYYGHYVGPAEKRDEGAKMAKGEIFAFIDDDAFPSETWLEKIVPHFRKKNIAGVGGPGVTPPNVSWREEASGWASASHVGAGPYIYRFIQDKKEFVEDYPSMNLSVRKTDFDKIGGFDSNFWPGEDTKLCLDLTRKLKKKIIYESKAVVYHHRRPILFPHLRQNGNYGLHRGYFAKILPDTSFKIEYFLPSVMLLGLCFIILSLLFANPVVNIIQDIGLICFFLYFLTLVLNAIGILIRSKSILQSAISIPIIFITHLWYGTKFIQGYLFTAKLKR